VPGWWAAVGRQVMAVWRVVAVWRHGVRHVTLSVPGPGFEFSTGWWPAARASAASGIAARVSAIRTAGRASPLDKPVVLTRSVERSTAR